MRGTLFSLTIAAFVPFLNASVDHLLTKDQIHLIGQPSDIQLQVVPYPRTPTLNNIELDIQYPRENSVEKNLFTTQLRLAGFPLGVESKKPPHLQHIKQFSSGQYLNVVVDNEPGFPVSVQSEGSPLSNFDIYSKTVRFKMPKNLSSGPHTMRIMTVLSFGETIKKQGNYAVRAFKVNQSSNSQTIALHEPYLTYNLPQGTYKLAKRHHPILLDFYISNCQLSRDGYKVLLKIDGEVVGRLYQWTPYLIYGLKPGKHDIQLTLLNSGDEAVDHPFGCSQRTIQVI